MIWESYPWKEVLLKDADIIERWCQRHLTQRGMALIERKIFVSAYAIRKLFEAEKLTTNLDGQSLRCSRIERTKSHITGARHDAYNLDEHYDFSKSSSFCELAYGAK